MFIYVQQELELGWVLCGCDRFGKFESLTFRLWRHVSLSFRTFSPAQPDAVRCWVF